MLVLARKKGQKIVAYRPDGAPIEIVVTEISGYVVRIGLVAPSDVTFLRGELEPRPDQLGGAEVRP